MPKAGFLKDMATMGIAGLTLFTAVLGGYIAYSLADKLGMIGVQHYLTGCLGAILGGVTVFDKVIDVKTKEAIHNPEARLARTQSNKANAA